MKKEFRLCRGEDPMKGITGNRVGTATTGPSLNDLLGRKLIDIAGDEIGTIGRIWKDIKGEPGFLGVKTRWWSGGTLHALPVGETHYSSSWHLVRVPFSKEKILNAPAFAADEKTSTGMQRDIFDYYNSQGGRCSQPAEEELERK